MMKSYREWANENLSVFTGIKPKYIPKKTMSQFKYGDMVEVRDSENHDWGGFRFYLGSFSFPNQKERHVTMRMGQDESNFDGTFFTWQYVRKPELQLTIEERLERIETALAKLRNP